MPSKSEKQREMMAIAEHHPGKLFNRNKAVLKMSRDQLHDFAVKPLASESVSSRKKRRPRIKGLGV